MVSITSTEPTSIYLANTVREGEAPRAYARGGGDHPCGWQARAPARVPIEEGSRKREEKITAENPAQLSEHSSREGEAPRAYARGGGDVSPDNRSLEKSSSTGYIYLN
jgi:hypothetical protein